MKINLELGDGKPIAGTGLTANQVDLSAFTAVIPSMSVMWLNGEPKVVINPKTEYPEGFDPFGNEGDVWSQGCLNIVGVAGDVTNPDSLGLQGYDINGNPIDAELTDVLEIRNTVHEEDYTKGRLFVPRVLRANRELRRLNMEEFGQYGAWLRDPKRNERDETQWKPSTMSVEQYDAWISSSDQRMKLQELRRTDV